MAGWHDTIDIMISLERYWGSVDGIRYGDGFMEAVERKQPEMSKGHDPRTDPGYLAKNAKMQLETAEPFFVSEEVFEMVDKAAKTWEDEPFQRTDLITPGGFVLLPRPFFSKDRHGKVINTRAFSWGPCQMSMRIGELVPVTGVYLMCYSDPNVEDDFYEQMQGIKHLFGMTQGLSLWHLSPWWFGETAPEIMEYRGAGEGATDLWTWLQAFFRLSMQQIISAQYTIPSRPFARRAKRAGRDPGVLVMKLRRSKLHHAGEGDGEGPDWQFQWLTRGHWRNQWYPSLKQHRQIWIAPYIKGPEGAPFKAPDLRVWTFNR